MRILICDDDFNTTQLLSKIVTDYFNKKHLKVPEISIYNNGESLLTDKDKKDIVFLDVEMPGFDGIYVGNELKKQNKSVIIFIVTSFMEYLDAAMRFHVFRYISKPVDKQRLFQNLDDALELYSAYNQKIVVETRSGAVTVSTNEIVYVEANGRKVAVHTTTSDYDSTQTIQFWAEQLPSCNFFQSHRSYIVNLAKVTSFDHEMIYLCDGQFRAYLTRRKFMTFKNAYLLFIESMR